MAGAVLPSPRDHGIWPDFPIKPCITDSIATVKADAALSCFLPWVMTLLGGNRFGDRR
jgi:hypothetical protein